MTPSTANELQSASASPIADQGDDGDAVNDDQGQNWLTIRRRCELCKQRKVRFSNTVAGLERARFKLQTRCESHIFKVVVFLETHHRLSSSSKPKLGFRLCWPKTTAACCP